MSKKGTGVVNVVRRTWDVEEYERKAAERRIREESGDTEASKAVVAKKFKLADPKAAGPAGSARAYLERRDYTIDIDSKVNTKEVVNLTDVVQTSGGYFCEVCECLLKDSASWLRHINGTKHQRKLGFSMRVKKVDVDEVIKKVTEVATKATAASEPVDFKARYEQKLIAREAELRLEREAKKERKLEEKRKAEEAATADEPVGEELDAEMLAMLGMGGFAAGRNA